MNSLAPLPLQAVSEILGGLGLVVYGLKVMSDGLQNFAGSRFRSMLAKAVSSRVSAALLGTGLASLLQSSSAASIIVVGFINAGLVSLYQALAIFIGTSLGATVAVQFIAFKPFALALVAIFIGTLCRLFFKRRLLVTSGDLLLGAGLLFLGLRIMETGMIPISESAILQLLSDYVFAWKIGAALFGSLLAFLVQSPAAATGIIIAFCGSGMTSFSDAVAMVSGCNLGAALMALVIAFGGSGIAKRAAILNLFLNAVAVMLAITFFPLLLKTAAYFTQLHGQVPADLLVSPSFTPPKHYLPRLLANAHTICSVSMLLLFLPLVGFVARAVKSGQLAEAYSSHTEYLDARILNTPTIAMLQVKNELVRMADIAAAMYDNIVHLFYRFDAKSARSIIEVENMIDSLHRQISGFLVLLSRKNLDPENSTRIPVLLQLANKLEQLADQSMKLLVALQKKKNEKISFSIQAMADLKRLASVVGEIVAIAGTGIDISPELAARVPELLQKVEEIRAEALAGHVRRMKTGHCTIEAGFLYNDMICALADIAACSANIIAADGSLQ